MYVGVKMVHISDLPTDIMRIIAANLVDQLDLRSAVQTYTAVAMSGRTMAAFGEALAESLASGPLLMHPCVRDSIAVPAPFPDGADCTKALDIQHHARLLGLEVVGTKEQLLERVRQHAVTVRPNVVPQSLRDVFACDQDARITVTTAKTMYRVKEEHLQGLDVVFKTNPVRRSAAAMRLYLTHEVMLASWLKEDAKLRAKAERARERAIHGPRPRAPAAPRTPAQLAAAARKARKVELAALLAAQGLELRADSRMCAEYIQYGGHVDSVVEMMVEMEFFVNHTEYSCVFSDIVDYHERYRLDRDDRWDRDEVSDEAKRTALCRFIRAGGSLHTVPAHLQGEAATYNASNT